MIYEAVLFDKDGVVIDTHGSVASAISLAAAPYSEPPQTLLADRRIATLGAWLDNERLVVGTIDETGDQGTAVVDLAGDIVALSPGSFLAVLE